MRRTFAVAVLIVVCQGLIGKSSGAETIKGRVTEPGKETVKITTDGDWLPIANDPVEIIMEIPGVEGGATVAEGKVTELAGDTIVAKIERAFAQIEKGMSAKIVSDKPQRRKPRGDGEANHLKNGGFEAGLQSWGTGYYETELHPGRLGVFWPSFILLPDGTKKTANVAAAVDPAVRHSGSKSFKITNAQPTEPHMYGSMSQRITGLAPHTDYIAIFWVKADGAGPGTLQITTDREWQKRRSIDAGSYDWKEFSAVFNTGNSDFVDFRIVSGQRGTVWIDDIVFKKHLPAK